MITSPTNISRKDLTDPEMATIRNENRLVELLSEAVLSPGA